MSDNAPGQPAGWYYAQGDPVGTQRYWDGRQWVGGPQPVGGAPAAASAGYGAEPAAGGYAAPSYTGAPGYGAPSYGGVGTGVGVPASYGTRFVAYLIDLAIVLVLVVVVVVLALILGSISSSLGTIVGVIGYLGAVGVSIWNLIIRQGQTGQSIGKSKQNIKLVADATGQPVGGGMAFVRYLLGGLISSFCYIDLLWPLWDADKKRLTDKILNFSVVQV